MNALALISLVSSSPPPFNVNELLDISQKGGTGWPERIKARKATGGIQPLTQEPTNSGPWRVVYSSLDKTQSRGPPGSDTTSESFPLWYIPAEQCFQEGACIRIRLGFW